MPADENGVISERRVHFTYKAIPDKNSLCQGDLIEASDDLKSTLSGIHPYFQNDQYKYFMVLTQSCDLVRRDSVKCKTPYITLAAVRSFETFFEKIMLSGRYAEKVNNFLLMNNKDYSRAYQLIERLYNNNEPDYFFLYRDESLGLNESMVASLKVSIALKSDLHYERCLAHKVLELSDEFKAKLGWLVGNIYSRVGTTDWDSIKTNRQKSEMFAETLRSRCAIGTKEQIQALKDALNRNADQLISLEDAIQFVSDYKIESQYDKAMKIIADAINTSGKDITQEAKAKILNAIKSKKTLQTMFPG